MSNLAEAPKEQPEVTQLREQFETFVTEFTKSRNGNASAGTRARKAAFEMIGGLTDVRKSILKDRKASA